MGLGNCPIVFILETEMNGYGGTERWLKDFVKVNFNEFHEVGIAKFKSEDERSKIFFEELMLNPNIKLINLNNVGKLIVSKSLRRIFGEKIYMYFFYQVALYLGNLKTGKELHKYRIAYLTSYTMIIPIKLLNPKIKIIYGTHNNDFSALKQRKKYSLGYIHAKISLALTDMVHYISEDSVRNINFKNKIISISNGIDTENFFPSFEHKSTQKVNILFVGRLEDYKGVKIVLEATKMLSQNSYFLTICGDGSLKNYVVANKPSNSKYLSNPSDEVLREIYRDNDILIFPSLVETFGLVLLESLASGLYCVVSDTIRPKFEEFADMNVLKFSKRDSASFAEALLGAFSKLPSEEKKKEVFNYIDKKYSIYSLYHEIAKEILEIC